jgi:hypothetical protein
MAFKLLAPTAPPYDPLAWEKKPFPEKCRMVCEAWALQGYGSPSSALVLYALKIALYVGMWSVFCGFTPGLGGLGNLAGWWLHPVAFQKAILWSMLFEGLGLGCGSGPLTGRYFPPFGGALHFLRPGTTKRPLFEGMPILGGQRRTWLDVALYLACVLALVGALISPALGPAQLVPIVVLVPILGVADRTLFLALRAEHYLTTALCFLLAGNWIAGAKAVQLALWFWAGVSKLNHHFPAVVCVMMSNSPVVRWGWIRRRMYRSYPDDLRPSGLAVGMSHVGTALELGVPILLALGDGGALTVVGLALMLALHGFITSSVPMGVPLEWNVMVVYGAFFLFGAHADVSLLSLGSPALAVLLVGALVVVPLLGNLYPASISFLCSMRYYAGNWPFSIWLFRGDSYRKLDRLTKSSAWLHDQLAHFYDRSTSVGLVGRVIAFRAMHLHGRTLQTLLPKAVDDLLDYEHVDGELVAGLALGWNFGDGHLHDEGLLRAVQAQCGFEEGELRCVFVESQPMFGSSLAWRIVDAKTGVRETGELAIAELRERQPWPAA